MSDATISDTKASRGLVQGNPVPTPQATVIGSTFTKIPLELRDQIYSYLLLDQNVTFLRHCRDEGSLSCKYDIGLFTVNKQISLESLRYFYSENNFVFLETNWDPFLRRHCNRGIPMIFGKAYCNLKHYALKITIHHSLHPKSLPCSGYAIMAGHHLEAWVALLNGFNAEYYPGNSIKRGVSIRTISFQDKTESPYYKDSKRATARIQSGIQGIRQTRQSGLQVLLMGISGQKSEESYLISSPLTSRDCLKLAQQSKGKGDELCKTEQCFKAQCEYAIAAQLLGAPLWATLENGFATNFTDEHVALIFQTWIAAADMASILDHTENFDAEYELIDVVDGCYEGRVRSRVVNDSEEVKICIRKATLQAKRGCPIPARATLREALEFRPDHEEIKAAFEEIKEIQLKRCKADVKKQFPRGTAVGRGNVRG